MSEIAFSDALARLVASPGLDPGLVEAAFGAILAGEWTPVQVGAFAAAVRVRGETAPALAAAARALRARMTPVDHGLEVVVDTCGTGGDGRRTINVSTAAAIVVAACGVPVAKHGNRSISSQCGSADVVEALGIAIDHRPERHAELLREIGITFLFAPSHHPALRHAAQARRELGVRTIFNALGPIANPARATHQLVGVYDDALRPMLAQVLAELGCERAWVVRSEDGLDEISPASPTRVTEVERGAVRERVVAPEDFGASRTAVDALRGGDAKSNATSIETIFEDPERPGGAAVLLNAAATLLVAGRAPSPREAFSAATDAVVSGRAAGVLAAWRRASPFGA